jgi:hypothetical protein
MIGVSGFELALIVFGVLLITPTSPPPWLWALNASGLACIGGALAYWCREAAREAG